MVSQHFREMLKTASAPFSSEELDAMNDGEAVAWLERNSDDPWIFHCAHDLNGHPKFIGQLEPSYEANPDKWFDDTEVTYLALRVLVAANDDVIWFHNICFHLCQQVIEKGVKSILALQCLKNGEKFTPKKYSHDLMASISEISSSVLPTAKVSRLREVADAFKLGHFVGKYAVNTGGGMAVGLDWMRPIDCYMKIIDDLFHDRLERTFIDRVIDGTAFGDAGISIIRCGISLKHIKLSLLWNNPVFFPNWQEDCRRLASD